MLQLLVYCDWGPVQDLKGLGIDLLSWKTVQLASQKSSFLGVNSVTYEGAGNYYGGWSIFDGEKYFEVIRVMKRGLVAKWLDSK